MNKDSILDASIISNSQKEEVALVDMRKFLILCFFTIGIYGNWWMYKSWKFFAAKDKLDIMPAARAIFAIFFAYSLFKRILIYSKSLDYRDDYSPILVYLTFFMLNMTGRTPLPFTLLSFFSFTILILPFSALNYAIEKDDQYNVSYPSKFNRNQMILVVLGSVFWILVIIALF